MRRCAAAAAVAAFLVGCGESKPNLVPVSGTVTVNGKPLEGAAVSFQPDPSLQGGLPASAMTGPDGTYSALTKQWSGVMPGKYHVVVSKSLLDLSKVPTEFKDDPFMAQLSTGPKESKTPKQRKAEAIEASFDRDIPPEGGQQDFDVKR